MLPIAASILERSQSPRTKESMVLVSVWADRGPEDRLATARRWVGATDPAKPQDTNVAVNDQGELTLAAGSVVALDTASAQFTTPAQQSFWSCRVVDQFSLTWNWLGTSKTYHHTGFQRTILRNDPPVVIPFVATGSRVYDSVRLMLGNSGNTNPLAPTAATAGTGFGAIFTPLIKSAPQLAKAKTGTWVSIYFLDVAQNRQVGNIRNVFVPDGTPLGEYQITGLAAGLYKQRKYQLCIVPSRPDPNNLGVQPQLSAVFSVNLMVAGFAASAVPAAWRLPIGGGQYLVFGGTNGYQSAGLAYRTLDVMSGGSPKAPDASGYISYSDVVPAGTGLKIVAYYTDSAALAAAAGVVGWTKLGAISSGDPLPPARYWRMEISMASTAQLDDAPRLGSLTVTYNGEPITFGTHAQAVDIGNGRKMSQAIKAINKVGTSSSALVAKAKSIVIGNMTIELAPEPAVLSLFGKQLRGRRVMVRVGYSDVPETMLYYEGVVRDITYNGKTYNLTVLDPIELADVSIPRERWPEWVSTTVYSGGQIVFYGNKSYLCLIGAAGQRPDIAPTYWQQQGTVWKDIVYAAGTHLCDVAADLLQNYVNLPTERIDLASLNAVKAALPNRVIGQQRVINVQENALNALSDIAWLLESYWTIREGRYALMLEAPSGSVPVMEVGPHDIKEGLQYSRGWAELKNECLILTQYLGTGQGSEQFANGLAVVDANSVIDYGMNAVQEFKDRWNLAQAELMTIATNFVNRWKNGRRIVKFDGYMRLLALEPGDVVLLKSGQLPTGDVSELYAIVMKKDLDWQNQTIQFTVMEI